MAESKPVRYNVTMLTLLLTLLVSCLATATVRDQSARATSTSFTDVELQCFAQEKVLYTDGQCYTLRQRGPCLEGQWLVFDPNEAERGNRSRRLLCRTRQCQTAARPVFWPEDGQCHKLADKKTLCPRAGNELRSDSYGDGECACVKTFARLEAEIIRVRNTSPEWEGDCYPLFRRGPCPARKILVPAVLTGYGVVARCHLDLCHRLNAAQPGASYVLHSADNTCYQLGVTGPPCRDDEPFNIHRVTNRPGCIGRVMSVFSGYGPRCDINALTGECRQQVFTQAQSFGYEVSRRRRKRRTSSNQQ